MVNPITLEVVRNALVAYADEMATVLCRTAYNMMIFEVRDYCVGIVDPEGNIIAQNTGGLPIFLADLGTAVTGAMEVYGADGFAPGDVLISNDPKLCGQHLNNVVVFAPVFYAGELVAFTALRAHWIDVGGGSRGFGSMTSQDVFEEGLQFCAIKIHQGGRPNPEVLRLIRDNIRFPDSSFGDLRAQIAGCHIGERRLGELFAKYGKETVLACVHAMWDQSEQLARAAIRKIPDGVYEAESFLDNDYVEVDKPVPVRVKVIVHGDEMTVDFSGMPKQVRGPINCGYSGGVAAARVAYKCLISPESGVTQGEFRPLKVVLPPGTLLSAEYPAPLGGWSLSLPTVIDTIVSALAPAMPERVPAGHKADMSGYAFYGHDEARSRQFICMGIFGGGWGGRARGDGVSGAVSICQGNVQNAPVEVQEAYYPLLIERHALIADSGGAGRWRGGLGVELEFSSPQAMFVNTQFQRSILPPWGLHGGAAGTPNRAYIEGPAGQRSAVAVFKHPVAPGERIVMRTGGGGGYGDPASREPELVLRDVVRGYVSIKAAREKYRVAIDAERMTVDEGETRRLRTVAGP